MDMMISEPQNQVTQLALSGRLEAYDVPDLKNALADRVRAGQHQWVLDLRQVTFIDSAGLGLLTGLMRSSLQHGGRVRVVVAPGSVVERIFALVRFDLVFEMYTSPEDALHSFGDGESLPHSAD